MTTNNKEVYQLKVKSSYTPPSMKLSEIAYSHATKYLEKELETVYSKTPMLKACYSANLRKRVLKQYKIHVLKSVLDNLEFEARIPSSAINNFSKQFFNEKIDTKSIIELSNDKEYSKYFIRHVGRYGNYDVNFLISEDSAEKMLLIANELKEEAAKMFMQYINK